jgi:hypothetical protein
VGVHPFNNVVYCYLLVCSSIHNTSKKKKKNEAKNTQTNKHKKRERGERERGKKEKWKFPAFFLVLPDWSKINKGESGDGKFIILCFFLHRQRCCWAKLKPFSSFLLPPFN